MSPVDHTLTMLETINRNRFLGCDTYMVFVDMAKCFDKLWLEDGILELWRAGMDPVDARMIYEMNKIARAIIETPCGTTEEALVLHNVCKQGTVYAVQIGCKIMERINGLGLPLVTCLGPGMVIGALTYVDDISGGGRAQTIERTIWNCRSLEDKKKASVNTDKSKGMICGNNEERRELTAEVKMGRLDMAKQYKLLGTWVNEEGDGKTNIKKRKEKGEGALKKINQMTQQNKVGKQEVPLKIDLYKTVFLATLLYNMEAWGRLTKDEMEDLESTQASTLKRLMKVPNTTSHPGVLNELGIWTVDYQLVYRRLMLYHNIINSKEDRVVKGLVLELEKYWTKESWVEKIKEDTNRVGINMGDFKTQIKSKIKKRIKAAIEVKMEAEIREKTTTKMRTVVKTGWGRKAYLNGEFSREDVSDIMKTKLHMLEFRGNYKKEGVDTKCRLCGDKEETTEHIFVECKMLQKVRRRVEIDEFLLVKDEVEAYKSIVRFKRKCDMLL